MLLFGRLGLPRFAVSRPTSLREAWERIASGEGIHPIAGGTSVIPLIKTGLLEVRELVDLSGVSELRTVRREGGGLSVGAMVTHVELVELAPYPIAKLLEGFSRNHTSPHIMNLATVGGAVASSTSSEDLLPILMALDAKVTLYEGDGPSEVPLSDYVARRDSFKIALVRSVEVRTSWDGWRFSFDKLSFSTLRLPAFCVVVGAKLSDRKVEDCRIAVSFADGLRPGRLGAVEDAVRGRSVDEFRPSEVSELVRGAVRPAGDVHFPADYRRLVTSRVVALKLKEVIGA
jgi:CO/xanthine dehydrogenase FAD-binding subunit